MIMNIYIIFNSDEKNSSCFFQLKNNKNEHI